MCVPQCVFVYFAVFGCRTHFPFVALSFSRPDKIFPHKSSSRSRMLKIVGDKRTAFSALSFGVIQNAKCFLSFL